MTAAEKKQYNRFLHPNAYSGEGGEAAQSQVIGGDLFALSPPQTFKGSPVVGSPMFGPNCVPTHFQRSISGSSHHSWDSSGPQLCDTISQKTLFYLISTLNAAFCPDYDFSDARSHEFSREPSLKWVKDSVRDSVSPVLGEEFSHVEAQLWGTVDEEIKLAECEIFSYNPDLDSDPYGEEGSLWSFNYFFYNKKMKRILFFTCRAISNRTATEEKEGDDLADQLDLDEGMDTHATPFHPSFERVPSTNLSMAF